MKRWSKVCGTLHAHPKAVDAGLEAMGLWVLALSHTSVYGHGTINNAAVKLIAGDRAELLARLLIGVRLWEETPTGFFFHDYHDYNPSIENVKLLQDARRGAGRRGGLARAKQVLDTSLPPVQASAKQVLGECLASDQASAQASAKALASKSGILSSSGSDLSGSGSERSGSEEGDQRGMQGGDGRRSKRQASAKAIASKPPSLTLPPGLRDLIAFQASFGHDCRDSRALRQAYYLVSHSYSSEKLRKAVETANQDPWMAETGLRGDLAWILRHPERFLARRSSTASMAPEKAKERRFGRAGAATIENAQRLLNRLGKTEGS